MIENYEDVELQLFSKKPIIISGIPIYPVSIDQIAEFGYRKYNKMLSFLFINKEYIENMIGQELVGITVFEFLVYNISNDDNILSCLLEGLSLICREDVGFSTERLIFIVKDKEINKDNFEQIQEVIRLRNGYKDIEEEIDNPANDKAKQLLEERKRLREKIKNSKKLEEGEGLTLGDLVSILASGMKLPIDTVMQNDLFQFNDQFNRLKMFDDYKVSIQALLAGASKDDVELKHWMSKIK